MTSERLPGCVSIQISSNFQNPSRSILIFYLKSTILNSYLGTNVCVCVCVCVCVFALLYVKSEALTLPLFFIPLHPCVLKIYYTLMILQALLIKASTEQPCVINRCVCVCVCVCACCSAIYSTWFFRWLTSIFPQIHSVSSVTFSSDLLMSNTLTPPPPQ